MQIMWPDQKFVLYITAMYVTLRLSQADLVATTLC